MTPASLCQRLTMQRWPSVQDRFQVRRDRPRSQRMVRTVLAVRLIFGLSDRVKWRIEVAVRETKVRRETERSLWVLDIGGGADRGERNTYDKEGPWYVVMLFMKMMNEEDQNDGHNEGRYPLADSDEVEDQRGILGRLLRNPPTSSCVLEHYE